MRLLCALDPGMWLSSFPACFLFPYLHSQAILMTDRTGVSENTHTDDTVSPPEKGDVGAVGARVLPALQGGFPFLGYWSHPVSV